MQQLPKDMHLKNLLMLRFGWFEDALFDQAEGTEYQNITRAESRVLSHLHYRNMSAAELGRALAITRQAAHRTVTRLLRKGWLVTVPHPTNARIKLVRPSAAVVKHAFTHLDAIEARLARRIGRKKLETLRAILSEDWD